MLVLVLTFMTLITHAQQNIEAEEYIKSAPDSLLRQGVDTDDR